jgi:NAD(P)H-flavin reductase
MIKKYKAEILEHINLIDNVYLIKLQSIGANFKYRPGQFLHLAIDSFDGIGQWPESRCFSIQSPPRDNTLKITYSTKGIFTNRMANELKVGQNIWLKLPYGNIFEEEHNKEKSVFIAGGTGITPYLSLFTDQSFSEYAKPYLFFGIRDKKFHLYVTELKLAQKINPSLEINLSIENIDGRPLCDEILKAHGKYASFFISGPQEMILFYKNSLITAGINEKNILTDDWE